MRQIDSSEIYNRVYQAVRELNVKIPADVRESIKNAFNIEDGPGREVLKRIIENMDIAEEKQRPVCQDTGMIIVFLDIGSECTAEEGSSFKEVIEEAVRDAYKDGFFRKSVVSDPLNKRENSGNNLPVIFHVDYMPGNSLGISILSKGFGSENCSRVHMLKPTAGSEAVINAVIGTVAEAGGSPCPPTVIGVGIGGTMEKAALLSKKALLRELNDSNNDPFYRELENEILNRINSTGIGPGGLGGKTTSLGVKIETFPTHIAGLPVAVSVNCWADRKAFIIL